MTRKGYCRLHVDNSLYLGHRLVWLYVYGKWPDKQLDHINGNRLDNRIANLREATGAENQQNVKLRADSVTGHQGVNWSKRDKRYYVYLRVDKKTIYLGTFSALAEAVEARRVAKEKYHTFHPHNARI